MYDECNITTILIGLCVFFVDKLLLMLQIRDVSFIGENCKFFVTIVITALAVIAVDSPSVVT